MKHSLALALLAAGAALLMGCESLGGGTSYRERPTNQVAVLQTQLGAGYMREGKNDLAYQRLRRALAADPSYSPAHNALALLYDRIGQPGEAEQHYRRAVELDPKNSAALTNFGSFLCRLGRVDEAEQRFLQALENRLYQNPAIAYTNAGLCMQRHGKPLKAEGYFRRALESNPKIPSALLAMSDLSLKRGRDLSARAYLQRYLEVGEHTPQSLWLGIQIERGLGDRNAVSSYAMYLKSTYPDAPETRLLLQSEAR